MSCLMFDKCGCYPDCIGCYYNKVENIDKLKVRD